MEQSVLVAISLLPLGLVAVVAYLMLTRKKKQAPKLKLVKQPETPTQKLIADVEKDMFQGLNAQIKSPKKKARKKRRPARGKRK